MGQKKRAYQYKDGQSLYLPRFGSGEIKKIRSYSDHLEFTIFFPQSHKTETMTFNRMALIMRHGY